MMDPGDGDGVGEDDADSQVDSEGWQLEGQKTNHDGPCWKG